MPHAPGVIRDTILEYLSADREATVAEITKAVVAKLGSVAPSSVRSYLANNSPRVFTRTGKGRYRLRTGRK